MSPNKYPFQSHHVRANSHIPCCATSYSIAGGTAVNHEVQSGSGYERISSEIFLKCIVPDCVTLNLDQDRLLE